MVTLGFDLTPGLDPVVVADCPISLRGIFG
jgi:hypothetical protein